MRLGIVCPPIPGHLNPMCALGRELVRRGHPVCVFGLPDNAAKVRSEGLEFHGVGAETAGTLAAEVARLGQLTGLKALRATVARGLELARINCRDLPAALRRERIHGLLVDQNDPAGGSVADKMGLPFVTVCAALLLNREDAIPPNFAPWPYRNIWWARLRNRIGYALFERLVQPITDAVNDYRRAWGLRPHRVIADTFSTVAQISQQTPAIDFAYRELPPTFHYTGPWRDDAAPPVSFPWHQLSGAPLVYATLGTLQNQKAELFHVIAAACDGLDVQLVLTHGGALSNADARKLPGQPLVVRYAPQRTLLARAALTIAHGGLNTVLDSLSFGVPLVVVPVTHEQPGIAARVAWSGAGRVVPLRRVTLERLRDAVTEVLRGESFGRAAGRVQASIQAAGGVARAADIIEEAVSARRVAATCRVEAVIA
jgi:MGT family glycosyltransferase